MRAVTVLGSDQWFAALDRPAMGRPVLIGHEDHPVGTKIRSADSEGCRSVQIPWADSEHHPRSGFIVSERILTYRQKADHTRVAFNPDISWQTPHHPVCQWRRVAQGHDGKHSRRKHVGAGVISRIQHKSPSTGRLGLGKIHVQTVAQLRDAPIEMEGCRVREKVPHVSNHHRPTKPTQYAGAHAKL
jgi:hypothetical protein